MGLINLVLKAVILILDLRDTYDALDSVKIDEIGRNERQVLVRNAQDGTKQLTVRKRVGTSKRKAAVRSALTTILVWNLFNKLEPLCDRIVAWFVPFYDSFKTLLLVWMLFTRSYGAAILVFRLLAPMIRPYESIIDGVLNVTLSLFAWMAALLAPTARKCARLVHTLRTTIVATNQAPPVVPVSHGHIEAIRRKASTSSMGGKARKKSPPPSSPPAALKIPSASATTFRANNGPPPQASGVATKVRQTLPKKTSRSNLAATRRVLQELPVPSHAFASIPSQSSVLESSASKAVEAASHLAPPDGNLPVVKTEPSEADHVSPAATLGQSPTSSSGLHNYAFIPGLTPQRSGPASLISPTPRFPGGFSFSVAGAQASASTSTNPFQSQARIPLTTQMAPLSLSSQPFLSRASVDSANDGRMVPPPHGSSSLRKVSSSRSLNGRAATGTAQNGNRAAGVSNGKKRARSDDASSGEVDAAAKSASSSTSPRKRAKPANGQNASRKTASGSVTTKTRVKKPTATNGQSAAVRKRVAANAMTSTSGKVVAPINQASTSTDVEAKASTGAPRSAEKKAKATATKSTAAPAKTTAQRTAVKKVASTSKSRSQSTEAVEASEPPQRLIRSRTKQNLAD